MNQNPRWVEFFREQYPPGTRVQVREMKDDPNPVPSGTEGTVELVDDACNIHCQWDNGRTLPLIPGVDRFAVLQPKLTPLKLYMPVTINMYERDEYGDFGDDPFKLSGRESLQHEGEILRLIKSRELEQEGERGLMHWYHGQNSVNDKVVSLRPTVEVVDGQLMGVAVCMVKGTLSAEELETLKDYASGQMSDGWGEGFEQQEIKADNGELYVSFWNSDKGWMIQTEEELHRQELSGAHTHGDGGTPRKGGMQFG